jgi:hypothetical protein
MPVPGGPGAHETLDELLKLIPPGNDGHKVLLIGETSGWIDRDADDPGLPDLMMVANQLIYDPETFLPKVEGGNVEIANRPDSAGAISISLLSDGNISIKETSSGRPLPSRIQSWK